MKTVIRGKLIAQNIYSKVCTIENKWIESSIQKLGKRTKIKHKGNIKTKQ